MMRGWSLILVVMLGGCTGSRTLVADVADPHLTGDADRQAAEEARPDDAHEGDDGADDGADALDDVEVDPVATDVPDPAAPPDPFADFLASLGAAGDGAGIFGGDGAAGGDFGSIFGGGADGGVGFGSQDGGVASEDGGDGSAAGDPATDLITIFLQLLAAFFGGAA